MEIRAILLGRYLHIEGAGRGIDNRGGSNSNLRRNGAPHVSSRHRGHSSGGICKIHEPKWRRRTHVCVKGIHTVVFGNHINDVVSTSTGNGESLNVKRLSIDETVHIESELLAELRHVDIRRR